MGLDMYLEASKYVSRHERSTNYQEPQVTSAEYAEVAKFFPTGADEFSDFAGAEVKLSVGYWRKANAIHNWFVTECAGGKDDCKPVYVSFDKLRELRATCEHLLSVKGMANETAEVQKLLPPTAGFFFGSTDIDEWFWNDIERTLKILNKAIPLSEDDGCSIIYQASW